MRYAADVAGLAFFQLRPDHPGYALTAGRFSLSEKIGRSCGGQAAALRGLAGPNAAAKPCRQLG